MYRYSIFIIVLAVIIPVRSIAQKKLTINEIYRDAKFQGKSLSNVQWVPQKQLFSYTKNEKGTSLWLYNAKKATEKCLITADKLVDFKPLKRERRITPRNHSWSPDGNTILFNSGKDLYLYSLKNKRMEQLTHDSASERDPIFSPDGEKIAYLKNNNLYMFDLKTQKEIQLTTTGGKHLLIGRFDWVYEEEFGIRTGFFWSPNSKYIAFFQSDESVEPEFPIVDYIPVHNKTTRLRYPKPGDHNAIVKIGVIAVENPAIVWMDIGEEIDIYIPRIKWLTDSRRLAIYRLNRQQNKLELLFADISSGKSQTILVEQESHGWIDITDDLYFLKNNQHFIWSSDRTGYRHLYLYDVRGNLIRPLTSGSWDVTKLIKVDENNGWLYFMATAKNIFERHLYKVNLQGEGFTRLTEDSGVHHINMNDDCSFYLDYFSNYVTPTQISLHTVDGKLKKMIEPNKIEALQEYKLSVPEIITFTTDDGVTLNAEITKPVDFDSRQKYPVIFTVYGGPGSQTIMNSWAGSGYLWRQLLTQHGYIVFKLDNRGTGSRGTKFMKQMYRRLGHFEVMDMINGVKYLQTLPYIDARRIGIWGWSYGGYTTIMCMLKAADYFKVGVAVAPVTDWKNYDTIYTERYMDTPQNNPGGYENSSALKYADQLKGKLLIIHGTADDNVHLANTLQLAFEFQKLGKQFDLMIYPQKMHGIGGVRDHLFTKITDYFLEHL